MALLPRGGQGAASSTKGQPLGEPGRCSAAGCLPPSPSLPLQLYLFIIFVSFAELSWVPPASPSSSSIPIPRVAHWLLGLRSGGALGFSI